MAALLGPGGRGQHYVRRIGPHGTNGGVDNRELALRQRLPIVQVVAQQHVQRVAAHRARIDSEPGRTDRVGAFDQWQESRLCRQCSQRR